MPPSPGTITHLLVAWRAGDETAKDQLFALLYEDLRLIAREQRKKWRGSSTLNTTALVHELYEKFSRQGLIEATDRLHFTLLVAKALRHILIDYAKSKRRRRRGGHLVRVPLDLLEKEPSMLTQQVDEILTIDMALRHLAAFNERLAHVVELRFFAGLTYDEIAELLGVTKRTITSDWAKAKAWLQWAMQEQHGEDTRSSEEGRS